MAPGRVIRRYEHEAPGFLVHVDIKKLGRIPFQGALGPAIKHKRTRPYRPQTNGKVERFNRTLLDEWAYAKPYQSEAERVAAFSAWLEHYNHHRGHAPLKGRPPASRNG